MEPNYDIKSIKVGFSDFRMENPVIFIYKTKKNQPMN